MPMKVSAPGNHKPPAQAPEPGRGSTGRPSLLTFVLTNPEKSGIIIGSGALAAPIPQPKGGTALIMGQKKKVLLAASLCTPAHLYVWDEPLNYIDIYSRMQIENLLGRFQPTMLFIEHDEAFRKAVASKTIEL